MLSLILPFAATVVAQCTSEACVHNSVNSCWTDRAQCTVTLAPGVIELSKTISICPGVTLQGAGSRESSSTPTILRTRKPITAVHILPRDVCRAANRPWVGRATIKHVWLHDIDHSVETSTISGVTHGILAESAPAIEDVTIIGYVLGVRITGGSNSWRMDDVSIQTAHHSGLLIHGHDTNVGRWDMGSSADNCFSASLWAPEVAKLIKEKPNSMRSFTACGGVVDHSFLGNTYISVHTATNYEHKPGCYANATYCAVRPYAGFRLDSTASRSLCLGCYTEGGQLDSYVGPQSMAIGGLSMWEGPGQRLGGLNAAGLVIRNGSHIVQLGNAQGSETAWITLREETPGWWPLRLVADTVKGQLILQPANTNALSSLRLQLTKTGIVPLGTITLGGQAITIK